MVSPDLHSMKRVQFCLYDIVEANNSFTIKKLVQAGGCWGGEPCCGWWSTATGLKAGSTMRLRFGSSNGTVARVEGFVLPSCSTFDLGSGEMYVRSNVSVWGMEPLVWLKTMTALTVRKKKERLASRTLVA